MVLIWNCTHVHLDRRGSQKYTEEIEIRGLLVSMINTVACSGGGGRLYGGPEHPIDVYNGGGYSIKKLYLRITTWVVDNKIMELVPGIHHNTWASTMFTPFIIIKCLVDCREWSFLSQCSDFHRHVSTHVLTSFQAMSKNYPEFCFVEFPVSLFTNVSNCHNLLRLFLIVLLLS